MVGGDGGSSCSGAAVVVVCAGAVVVVDSVWTRRGGSLDRLGTPAMATPNPAPTKSMSR